MLEAQKPARRGRNLIMAAHVGRIWLTNLSQTGPAHDLDEFPVMPVRLISGSPEGVFYAPIGTIVVDGLTGDIYSKHTPVTSNTGWGQLTFTASTVPALIPTTGSPEGVINASPPSLAWDSTNKILYIKDTGVNTNTGWIELIAGAS